MIFYDPSNFMLYTAAVHGVAKSQTQLRDFTFTFHFHALEKEMATHSSVLAWRIPGMGEPGGLPFMGSCRVGHTEKRLSSSSHLKMWFRVRALYLILLEEDALSEEVRDEGG